MYSGSAESTDLALNKLKELKIDESTYFVKKDSNAFEESLESVSGIKHIIKIMTYSIMLGGMVVLSLILILWLRERIYEIGIFLSIGTSKIQIIMQFYIRVNIHIDTKYNIFLIFRKCITQSNCRWIH